MQHKEPILVTFSGGPGAGKTTVLQRLKERGYQVASEVARDLIAERKASGLSPRPSPKEFAQAILERDIQQYQSAAASELFFDRSILDSLAMLAELEELSEDYRDEILTAYPYYSTAFIFPPWEDIYRVDQQRDQSYEEGVRVYEAVCRCYSAFGYALVEVPVGPVDDRCDFILEISSMTVPSV